MEGDVDVSDGGTKRSVDAPMMQTTHKRRAPLDYKEKESKEFKLAGNLYRTGWYNNDMDAVHFDDFSVVSIPDVIHRGYGRPAKVPNHRSTARFQRRCQELVVMVAMVHEAWQELVDQVRYQRRVLVALSSSRREMDELKLKAAALEPKMWQHQPCC
jgi:hypothetical protein